MQPTNILAAMAQWFAKNSRASILILLSVLAFGAVAYTTLLPREGFPAIQFPIVIVRGTYLVDSANRVDERVVSRIEAAVKELDEVNSYQTSADANSFSLSIRYNESEIADERADELAEKLRALDLPRGVQYNVIPLAVDKQDGENDLIFSVYNPNLKLRELVKEARIVRDELKDLEGVDEVVVKNPFETRINPRTGRSFTEQTSFGRVAYLEEGEIKFADAVNLGVRKSDGTDAVTLSQRVRLVSEEVKADDLVKDKTEFDLGNDIATEVNSQIASLEANTLAALIIILIVTVLVIGWRAAVIAGTFLLTVLAATFATLYFFDVSLNVISLFALVLVVGLLVDDVVVVVEAIDIEKQAGLKGVDAVVAAINKVGVADMLGTLTTVIVFIPMFAIGGILGEFIGLIPFTVIVSLAFSLLFALTVFAWMSSRVLKDYPAGKVTDEKKLSLASRFSKRANIFWQSVADRIASVPARYVGSTSASAVVAVVATLLVFGILAGTAAALGFDIFPATKDADELAISVDFPANTSLKKVRNLNKRIEGIYDNESAVTSASYLGGIGRAGVNPNGYTIRVKLTPYQERVETAPQIAERLNDKLEDLSDVTAKAQVISAGPPSEDYPYQMQVFVNNKDRLEKLSKNIRAFLRDYEEDGLKVEEVKLSGLNVVNRFEGRRYALLQVKFNEVEITSQQINALTEEIKKEYDADRLADFGLEEDALGFDLGIESDNAESFVGAGVALAIALVCMFAFLVILFNSFTQPALIFSAIPFALAGVLPGLLITNNSMSFFVLIGIIALSGIVVNNTILLLDFANQAVREGADYHVAIIDAIKRRFRPLLATSATTVVGLLPLAVSDPFWESLAFTIIFGLIASTTLVLMVFPAYYVLVEELRNRIKNYV